MDTRSAVPAGGRAGAFREAMLASLEDLVMTETPSEDVAAVGAGCRLVSRLTKALLGEVPELIELDGRPHLRLRTGSSPRVLVLGHLDTVWPLGTAARWPFRVESGQATGPGVFDMKAGLVQSLYALSDLDDLGAVSLVVTTDEEIGSPTSRQLVEDEARAAEAVLVAEPSFAGALKTARKGVSLYRMAVTGVASHAGLSPDSGVNALLELAALLPVVASLRSDTEGTTVSPTMARAGTATNTIPANAEADVDVRAWSAEEQGRVDRALRALRPTVPGAQLTVTGGVNRPPLEPHASRGLFALAQGCAARLGLASLRGAAVGGGSDGNFTAAIGVPTLDGLGAVGGNAHAEGEWVDVGAMGERTALFRQLLASLTAPPAGSTTEHPPGEEIDAG